MGVIAIILMIVIVVVAYNITGSMGFAILSPIILLVIIGIGYVIINGKKAENQTNIKNADTEKGKSLISNNFSELFNSAPSSPDMYNIVTIQDTTLKLYLGKFKVWRIENTINVLAYEDDALRLALGNGKINNKDQLYYSFNVDNISLFERENTEQIVTKTQGGGSHLSLWTGNEKVGRVYTTEHTVGNKCTLLYIENNPVDTKIMFDYEDYSVLNRLINK